MTPIDTTALKREWARPVGFRCSPKFNGVDAKCSPKKGLCWPESTCEILAFGFPRAFWARLSEGHVAFRGLPLIRSKERRSNCREQDHGIDQAVLFFGFIGRARNIGVSRPQRRRPAFAQIVKIGLARLDAVVQLGVISVTTRDQYIEGQADAEVGAHRGVHGNE